MPPESPSSPLGGRVIALPEHRELDRLAELLEGEGARVWRCPLVAIVDAPDQAPVEVWLRELASGAFDDVVLLTGEGLRRLMAAAGRLGLTEAVVAALARARKVTRGPKPARALKDLGLSPDLAASVPTSAGVAADLAAAGGLGGRRVGLQLYGEEPNAELVEALTRGGATVRTVAPYIYAAASDEARVADLVGELAAGRIDAIAFTSAAQVDRIAAVARARGLEQQLAAGWTKTRVAAIGPVAASALRQAGVEPTIIPERSFVMKRLVQALVTALAPTQDVTLLP